MSPIYLSTLDANRFFRYEQARCPAISTTFVPGPLTLAQFGRLVEKAPMSAVLSVQNVTKVVRDGESRRTIVDNVSFDLGAGETACLRGASGSGKTTLLALSGGMLSPTKGEVCFRGEAISRLRDRHRAEVRRAHVGFVFQDFALVDDLSVLENVLLPKVPLGISSADTARAESLLERFGIASFRSSVTRRLSGGERQRVALCRALIFDPAMLLLDEPSAHLDDARTEALASELATLASEGKTVLFASHDTRLTAPRTILVESGKIHEAIA